MGRTPDYVLTAQVKWSLGSAQDERVLPPGAFVRPIWEARYLPAHIRDSTEFRYFDPIEQVYCYTRWGITRIDRKILRQV